MSDQLSRAGIEHIVLEQGATAGHRWKTERWDSLRLLTPNWMNHLAGARYAGRDPHGYITAAAFGAQFDLAVAELAPPLWTQTKVRSITGAPGAYEVSTTRGTIQARAVVLANGACAHANVPEYAKKLPDHIQQETAQSYKRPDQLADGPVLVTGASASGLQIARELASSGRAVTLAVGNHLRLPRLYRGEDIVTWLDVLGRLDVPHTEVDDLDRVRRTPSLSVIGTQTREDLDLNALQRLGVEVTGRFAAVRDETALFSGGVGPLISAADLKLLRLRDEIDAWVDHHGIAALIPPPTPFVGTQLARPPRLTRKLADFSAVVWATGYRPDFSWLHLPVFDRKGRLEHDGGRVAPGMVAMGLPYLRNRRSGHIDGALRDAEALLPELLPHLLHQHAA